MTWAREQSGAESGDSGRKIFNSGGRSTGPDGAAEVAAAAAGWLAEKKLEVPISAARCGEGQEGPREVAALLVAIAPPSVVPLALLLPPVALSRAISSAICPPRLTSLVGTSYRGRRGTE
ncbi:hypothetical protein NDU88_010255 [Pleurodeles waltl]|uniref:Uncharacterized protein n=1 Tax=Pleurodeles waltl TaxID=8319 RepID=A0AAV7PV54_PLEWA|nr:hypothetical protein NDU88_010255 [Pleurodeles waltl]